MTGALDLNELLRVAKEVESDYLQEVEKNKKLQAELHLTKVELERLRRKSESNTAGREEKLSDSRVLQIQKQLNVILKELREETERLKSTYPIFDLLSAKQAEVDRMKKALGNISKDHPERLTVEAMVKSHIRERDELQRIAQEAEDRLKTQLEKIHAAYLLLSRKPSGSADGKEKPMEWIRVPEF